MARSRLNTVSPVVKVNVILFQAVKHLHDNNLVHVDIKPDNIFISYEGVCKLGDFGLVIDLAKVRHCLFGLVEQSVTCITADPGFTSLIPAQSHTFVEIAYEIISTVSLLPLAESLTVILFGHFYSLIWESFPIQKWPLFSQLHVF